MENKERISLEGVGRGGYVYKGSMRRPCDKRDLFCIDYGDGQVNLHAR